MSDAEIRNLFNSATDDSVGGVPPASFAPPFAIQTADAWVTDGAGGFYYDLVHNRGRAIVLFQIYDPVTNDYIYRIKSAKPLTGSETTTLRITLTYDAPDNRLQIGYL